MSRTSGGLKIWKVIAALGKASCKSKIAAVSGLQRTEAFRIMNFLEKDKITRFIKDEHSNMKLADGVALWVWKLAEYVVTVSYTHLTLPTN